jgi:hypothetical protein
VSRSGCIFGHDGRLANESLEGIFRGPGCSVTHDNHAMKGLCAHNRMWPIAAMRGAVGVGSGDSRFQYHIC